MKKHGSQVVVAVVCAILGFLLSYQYKELAVSSNSQGTDYNNTEILNEVEGLKKEKEELILKNDELAKQLASLESGATEKGEVEQEIKKQLDTSRMQLGLITATGPGIKIKMNLKSSMFSSNALDSTKLITDSDLVSIVNTLWFSKAEAISINGFRITPQTGIKVSGNYIWIGSAGRVIPSETIEIKAIGDVKAMQVGLNFQAFNYGNFNYYDISMEDAEDLVIEKTTTTLKSDFLSPVGAE